MKQSLAFRLAILFVSVVITAVLFESVAELGYPASDSEIQVAQATVSATPPVATPGNRSF